MNDDMLAPPRPKNEPERLALLRSCGVLDSEPEPAYDDVARLASLICHTPIALVSLVDRDRQWFKARIGLAAAETSRDVSFCAHALDAPDRPLVVRDALNDPRFADNPLVTSDPSIRFYAGVPLVLEDGAAVGTLCVIDHVPRELTSEQMDALALLARQVTTELRLRRRLSGTAEAPTEEPAAAPSRTQARGSATVAVARARRPAALQVGTVAGRYVLEDIIGAGGMGVVMGATDMQTGRRVAVKFVLPEARDDEAVERFVREARMLIRLGGEHVTQLLDAGNLGNGAPFIVMERLEGEDLDAVIDARAPLPIAEAVDYLRQACVGVAHVHAAGILHRDLKPSNLFLARRPDGPPVLKVLDFGIAKLCRDADGKPGDLSREATLLGSPHYMSPEQMSFGATVDVRTDVWSLGVVLYELLAFHRPFAGEFAPDICTNVLLEPPIALENHRPDVPPALARVVERCLAKDRADRFPSVAALGEALAAAAPPDRSNMS